MNALISIFLILIALWCTVKLYRAPGTTGGWFMIKTVLVWIMALLFVGHLTLSQMHLRELEERRVDMDSKMSKSIWNQSDLTNGSYAVLGVYPTEVGCLAILQPIVIVDISLQSRTVTFTNTGGLPRLFSLDTRLADPEGTNSSGLAEVYTGTLRSAIRDYRPFVQLPPKRE